jgi:hypothetical protein
VPLSVSGAPKKESPAFEGRAQVFSVTLAAGGKTTPSARLRGGLRVIDGETLLQKLSDYSCGAPNFTIIAGHRAKVPLPHARRHGSSPDGKIPGGPSGGLKLGDQSQQPA